MEIQDKLMDTRVIIEPETDELIPLFYIVDNFRRDMWLKPPHQRDRVWSDSQKRGWIERLQSGRSPVGVIVTYQIINEGPIRINDGFQRVSTTLEYLDASAVYGDTVDEATRLLFACKMPHQHRHYKTSDEALMDFQLLNLGTHLTPYEFCKGILVYMPGYESWEPILDSLHRLLPTSEARIVSKRTKTGREEGHKRLRHDYALFHRFLVHSKFPTDYTITDAKINPRVVANHSVVEWQMRNTLRQTTPVAVREDLVSMERLIERETALLETIWFGDLKKPIGSGISPTLYRWIMDCAVWRRNMSIEQGKWEEFVRALITISDGKSQISKVGENKRLDRKYTLNLGRLSSLKGVCEIIESDLYSYTPLKRSPTLTNIRPGYDESHMLPFSQNGNGDVFLEPAGTNRARGARPVEISTR